MIDFDCCEVLKAVKLLYSDNEVLSLNPILKPVNTPFLNDPNVVYYGRFSNAKGNQVTSYRGNEIQSLGVTMFNDVQKPDYASFQGYEIQLLNGLKPQAQGQNEDAKYIINFVLDSSMGGSDPFLFIGTQMIYQQIFDGHTLSYEDALAGFNLTEENEVVHFSVNNQPEPFVWDVNLSIDDFVPVGNNFVLTLTFYNVEVYYG